MHHLRPFEPGVQIQNMISSPLLETPASIHSLKFYIRDKFKKMYAYQFKLQNLRLLCFYKILL